MKSTQFHVCKPVTDEHRRGMKWFSSLTQRFQADMNLRHSVEFYSLYAMTGDVRYLHRCEDFLRDSLGTRKSAADQK